MNTTTENENTGADTGQNVVDFIFFKNVLKF